MSEALTNDCPHATQSMTPSLSARQKLIGHREIWQRKPVLRRLYREYYRRIEDHLPSGATHVVELGGGSGNLKTHLPTVISTDLVACDWLDAVLDAQAMPFANSRIDAFVAVDVLHHLEHPLRFFREAVRCLRPGGRILLVDPYISPMSFIIFKLLHPEPVDLSVDFFTDSEDTELFGRDPWDANQAMATVLFWKRKERFERQFPRLRILSRQAFDWVWPLTGGFSYPALVPPRWADWLFRISDWELANKVSAFHAFVVIEKTG